MPYNKGDFTQQGINGDVSALVRLNEKRVMKVVLSSDDESDNCDISGKVYDLLNGTSYDIGSGVSGNIEITENGENINVAPYATATVNVSGGGTELRKCALTIVNETSENMSPIALGFAFYTIVDNMIYTDMPITHIDPHDSVTYDVIYQLMYDDPSVTPLVPIVTICGMMGSYSYVSSNAINCEIDEYGGLMAINPALDSSVTITVSPSES